MSAYILMIGLLVNDSVVPLHELSGTRFDTLHQCEDTINHAMVRTSYETAFPDHDVRFWCEPIQAPASVKTVLSPRPVSEGE